MILNKRVNVKVGTKSFSWYKEKGYNPKCGEMLEISIDDITTYSSAIVDVECQLCKIVKKKKYFDFKYSTDKSNDGKYYCKKCSYENIKKTNLIRYGYDTPLNNPDIIKKSKETMIRKFGVDNISKVDYIKLERSDLMFINTSEYNKIILNKYGTNVSKLDWIKNKKKETTLRNYGVENPSQNSEIFEKSQKSGKKIKYHDVGIYYRGTYEKHFLDFCLINNIKVEKGATIKYLWNGKNKVYHSDFFIPSKNLIIEIKSSYYYEKYSEINEAKRKETLKIGYNHIFIIDKDYTQFLEIIL
jgi:hypothetical protein